MTAIQVVESSTLPPTDDLPEPIAHLTVHVNGVAPSEYVDAVIDAAFLEGDGDCIGSDDVEFVMRVDTAVAHDYPLLWEVAVAVFHSLHERDVVDVSSSLLRGEG